MSANPEYYVDFKKGNDESGDGSPEKPFKTMDPIPTGGAKSVYLAMDPDNPGVRLMLANPYH